MDIVEKFSPLSRLHQRYRRQTHTDLHVTLTPTIWSISLAIACHVPSIPNLNRRSSPLPQIAGKIVYHGSCDFVTLVISLLCSTNH